MESALAQGEKVGSAIHNLISTSSASLPVRSTDQIIPYVINLMSEVRSGNLLSGTLNDFKCGFA